MTKVFPNIKTLERYDTFTCVPLHCFATCTVSSPSLELLLFHDPYLALFYLPPTPGICPSYSQKPTAGPARAPHLVMGLAIRGRQYNMVAGLVGHMMAVGQPLKST